MLELSDMQTNRPAAGPTSFSFPPGPRDADRTLTRRPGARLYPQPDPRTELVRRIRHDLDSLERDAEAIRQTATAIVERELHHPGYVATVPGEMLRSREGRSPA